MIARAIAARSAAHEWLPLSTMPLEEAKCVHLRPSSSAFSFM